MKKVMCMVIAVGAVGCASVDRIERSGDRHEARAKELEAAGDTVNASKERASAAKQYSKANSRRGFEDAMPIVFK
jgi:hypothetical protein